MTWLYSGCWSPMRHYGSLGYICRCHIAVLHDGEHNDCNNEVPKWLLATEGCGPLKGIRSEEEPRTLLKEKELKNTHSMFKLICVLVCKKTTFESRENKAMSAAILYLTVRVCGVTNKVSMGGRVHHVMSQPFFFLCVCVFFTGRERTNLLHPDEL